MQTSFRDVRQQAAGEGSASQLSAPQQEDYKEQRRVLFVVRQCSLCKRRYTLGESLGDVLACHDSEGQRDHFDFETENEGDYNVYKLPYYAYQCLQQEGFRFANTIAEGDDASGEPPRWAYVTRRGGALKSQ